MTSKLAVLKLCAVLAVAFSLGGCNLVTSKTPVFTASDAAGAPQFKPGLWASPNPGCDFKESDPYAQWPSCANGGVITPDALVATVQPTQGAPDASTPAGPKTPTRLPYVLAAGDPRVMQINFALPLGDLGTTTALFYFVAVKPTSFDASGRIVAAELWPVQCGPPPAQPKTITGNTSAGAFVTAHPLPGLIVNRKDGTCTTADKAALTRAAAASRGWADQVGTLRWVREAGR